MMFKTQLKMMALPIFILMVACNQIPQSNITEKRLDTTNVFQQSNSKKDSLSFNEFEKLVKNEEYIPLDVFQKFVKLNNVSLYNEETKFIGKSVTYEKNFKFIHIKQGDKKNGNEVLVTYSYLNKQIDVKTFVSYCESCPKDVLLSIISFLGNGKNNDFIVQYYKPTKSKAMPDIDNLTVLRKEKWLINSNGFFILNK